MEIYFLLTSNLTPKKRLGHVIRDYDYKLGDEGGLGKCHSIIESFMPIGNKFQDLFMLFT